MKVTFRRRSTPSTPSKGARERRTRSACSACGVRVCVRAHHHSTSSVENLWRACVHEREWVRACVCVRPYVCIFVFRERERRRKKKVLLKQFYNRSTLDQHFGTLNSGESNRIGEKRLSRHKHALTRTRTHAPRRRSRPQCEWRSRATFSFIQRRSSALSLASKRWNFLFLAILEEDVKKRKRKINGRKEPHYLSHTWPEQTCEKKLFTKTFLNQNKNKKILWNKFCIISV